MAFKLAEAFVQFSARGHNKVGGAVRSIKDSLTGMRRIASGPVGILLGIGGVGSVGALGGFAVKLAADYETLNVSFKTLLKSGTAAQRMLESITAFAASTPNMFNDLADSAKKLIAFKFGPGSILPTMRALGDVAAGLNIPIGEIAEIYGKARVQGRLFMEDINQLTARGIPIIGELAKQFGVAESQVRNLVSTGRINFSNLEAAFASLTGKGGQFFNMMAEQSKTLSGKWSTMKDNITVAMRDIGQAIVEEFDFKGLTDDGTSFAKAFRSEIVPSVIEGLRDINTGFGMLYDGVRGGQKLMVRGKALFTNTATDAARIGDRLAELLGKLTMHQYDAEGNFFGVWLENLKAASEEIQRAGEALDENDPLNKFLERLRENATEAEKAVSSLADRGKFNKMLGTMNMLFGEVGTKDMATRFAETKQESKVRRQFDQFNNVLDTFLGRPADEGNPDTRGNARRRIRAKVHKGLYGDDADPTQAPGPTASRFNIGDLANRIQDSVMNKQAADIRKTREESQKQTEQLQKVNTFLEQFPGMVFQ